MALSHPSEKLPVNFPNFAPKLRTIPTKMRGHAHAQSNHGSKARRTRGTTTQSASRLVASVVLTFRFYIKFLSIVFILTLCVHVKVKNRMRKVLVCTAKHYNSHSKSPNNTHIFCWRTAFKHSCALESYRGRFVE